MNELKFEQSLAQIHAKLDFLIDQVTNMTAKVDFECFTPGEKDAMRVPEINIRPVNVDTPDSKL